MAIHVVVDFIQGSFYSGDPVSVPVIHCHTQSDKSTVGYVTFMWETMRALANHPDALKLSTHCIGPTATDKLTNLPQGKTYYVPDADREKGMSGSTAHGACIEHALQMTDDGDIHLLMDSDTVVIAKGWDDFIRISLIERRIGMIGTAVEDLGGFTSGAGNIQMAKNLPTVAWCALSPLHIWHNLKAMPRKQKNISITNEELSKIYNLPVGYQVLCDVAWQIPEYLHTNKISYQAWRQLKPSKDASVLKGLTDYHEEYHLSEPDSCPFVVHQRGSMRHQYRGDRVSQGFYNAVDAYLELEKAREPRWTWVDTAENQNTLASIQITREHEKMRIAEIEKSAAARVAALPAASSQQHIEGWLKATLDGNGVWGRYKLPVPQVISVVFTPELNGKNLRLEGTVSGVHVTLPATDSRPHVLTVRNLTAGLATLKTENGRVSCDVPIGKCWQVIVDVDGVVHVE